MTRYVAIPSTAGHYDEPVLTAQTVIIDDAAPIRTGLLDQHGLELYRLPERATLGYIRRQE